MSREGRAEVAAERAEAERERQDFLDRAAIAVLPVLVGVMAVALAGDEDESDDAKAVPVTAAAAHEWAEALWTERERRRTAKP